MKILLSAYACEPNKGSEPAVGWHWANELSKLGHEVWVITRSNNKPVINSEFSRRPQPENLHFVYYDLPSYLKRFKNGRRFVHIYYLLWQRGAYKKASTLHRKIKFDLVHHVTFVSVRQPSFMGDLGIPFIFGPVAGGESAPWRLRFNYGIRGFVLDAIRDLANFCVRFDPFMLKTFQQAQRIYVTSEQTKRLIPRRFQNKINIQLAIGIDSIFDIARPLSKKPIKPRILYVGQFIYWKGMGLGIRAFAEFLSKIPDARLTMVGNGPDEKRFRNLAQRLNILDKIDWIPWIERDKLSDIYIRHDIFLYPSLHDSGGMVVLEALSAGLPVICLNIGGPGIIIDESCGMKLSPKDMWPNRIVEGLTSALFHLKNDSKSKTFFSQKTTQRASMFEWKKLVENIYRIS